MNYLHRGEVAAACTRRRGPLARVDVNWQYANPGGPRTVSDMTEELRTQDTTDSGDPFLASIMDEATDIDGELLASELAEDLAEEGSADFVRDEVAWVDAIYPQNLAGSNIGKAPAVFSHPRSYINEEGNLAIWVGMPPGHEQLREVPGSLSGTATVTASFGHVSRMGSKQLSAGSINRALRRGHNVPLVDRLTSDFWSRYPGARAERGPRRVPR